MDIRYFLSYAHADQADVDRFLDVFQPQLASAAGYHFKLWMDRHILPGENWKAEIAQALDKADFGLLLVSPQFLSSRFITEVELAALLSKPMVVPVALHPVLFDGTMDLKGLAERQIFRDAAGRAFDECRSMHTRRAFVRELYQQIHKLLGKYATC